MKRSFLLTLPILLLSLGCQQKTESRPFVVFQSEKDGHPLFAIIDKTTRDDQFKGAFPWYLGISTQLTAPTPDGLPNDQEASALNEWEDSLEKEIGKEGRFVYVGRLTWNGTRTVLYYVDKPDHIVVRLKKIADGHVQRAFNMESQRDDHWDRVSEYLKSARDL